MSREIWRGKQNLAKSARDLMIDRWYRLAKRNLKLLPEIRENGLPRYLAMRDPMNKRSIEESMTAIEEK